MTVRMQTRVEATVAENFKRAAKQRGMTPYAYLKHVITVAAGTATPGAWDGHREKINRLKLKRLPYNIVVRNREECDER